MHGNPTVIMMQPQMYQIQGYPSSIYFPGNYGAYPYMSQPQPYMNSSIPFYPSYTSSGNISQTNPSNLSSIPNMGFYYPKGSSGHLNK